MGKFRGIMRTVIGLFTGLIICVSVTACTQNENIDRAILTQQKESIPVKTSIENENIQQEKCIGIIVARAGDYETWYFDNDGSTELYIHTFENLRSMALRDKAGISGILQSTDNTVYPILDTAEEIITTDIEEQGYISSDTANSITWVRLLYDPYVPGTGVNDLPHKDIIFATTDENFEDSYLIIQDPETLTNWNYMELETYGQWLDREVDMLLAQTTGF